MSVIFIITMQNRFSLLTVIACKPIIYESFNRFRLDINLRAKKRKKILIEDV